MLVVENGNDATMLLKRVGDFLKETPTRIEMLLLVVERIGTVFADADDTVNRNSILANGHGLFDGGEHGDVVFF